MKGGYIQLESRSTDHTISLRLFGFVLASVALHSVALLSDHASFELVETPNLTMQIALDSITPTKVATPPNKIVQKTPAKISKTVKPLVPKANSANVPESVTQTAPAEPVVAEEIDSETDTAITPSTAATPNNEQQRISLKQRLKQALAEQFYYPILARKRGWEGHVLLAFTLDTRGSIINARITQSSGYGALDRAALKSLNSVGNINAELSREYSFDIPIIYSLNGV